MAKTKLRFRQIHLDFHTSEQIAGIGAQFDADDFAGMLEKARVNSVTCFARGHHGWLYYYSAKHPKRQHPHLTRDLLREQIAACHARDIRVPIYVTVQWDFLTAQEHPEWLTVDEKGCPNGTPIYEAGFYRRLCVNSPYLDFLKEHTRDVLETLPTDGFFFDIVAPVDCSCRYCRAKMQAQGIDPADAGARRRFAAQTIDDFRRDMTRFVHQIDPTCTVFYNQGHVGPEHRRVAGAYTHWELESLPSGGWGYLHFTVAQRYARTLGLACLGMTGKFHTSWGDFHSFKNLPALEFECYRMLALGAQCSIGDQLHPSGAADHAVYDLIGKVYREVERKEPWCRDARPLVDIGVLTPEEFYGGGHQGMPPALMGITRMLEESAMQFDILDSQSEFAPYRVIVLPDHIPVGEALATKLDAYLAGGGALIASFESGMDGARAAFALPALGVRLKSEGPRDADGELVRGKVYPRGDYAEYVMPRGEMGQGLPQTEHVMNLRGMDVEALPGTTALMEKVQPYFDRTWEHFCSHRQTPSSGQAGGPAVVRRGRAIYFASPLFTEYQALAPRWDKQLFLNALALLLPEPLVRHHGPSTLQIAVNEQADEDRWVVHLLHYIPERRSQYIDVIEDVIPLYNVEVSVRAPNRVQRVACVPGGAPLPFQQQEGYVTFTLPEIEGHQMVEIAF